jgi:ATP-dependent helicase/nuclease subunit A
MSTPQQPILQPLDQHSRSRILNQLSNNLIVEASAGTGKTTALIGRVIAAIESGAEISKMALVTFTIKAAGEMKFRLRKRLEEARVNNPDHEVSQRLQHAQAHLEEAFIGTIHAFCGQILRERPVEAGVDPLFKEATPQQQRFLFDDSFTFWLNGALQKDQPGIRRALLRAAWTPFDRQEKPLDGLMGAARAIADWRHFDAAWRRDPLDRNRLIDGLVSLTRKAADLRLRANDPRDELARSLEPANDVATWIERTGLETAQQYDVAEARLIQMLSFLKKPWHRVGKGPFGKNVTREDLSELRKQLVAHLETFKSLADAHLAATLHQELSQFVRQYDESKLQQGFLDFHDLILRTRHLVRSDPTVRQYLRSRYTHLFVDEFQDTDPAQAETLILLAAESDHDQDWQTATLSPGKLFAVGDPKQSIYKFRQADVGMYEKLKQRLSVGGLQVVQLSHSFRANDNLQAAINYAFQNEMVSVSEGHCEYEPLIGQQQPLASQPSLVALPIASPANANGKTTKDWIKKQTPGTIVGFLSWLLDDSGWQVRDSKTNQLVPVQAHHVCLLFRKFDDYGTDGAAAFTKPMDQAGIAYTVSVTKDFSNREEVAAVITALEAVEWPSDELSVYATLRGPLFGFADDDLYFCRESWGRLQPLAPQSKPAQPTETDKTAADAQAEIVEALQLLGRLHRQRNYRSAAATISDLLQSTRAYAGFALRAGGAQAVANLGRLIDIARRYEVDRGLSFRDFVGGLLDESLISDEDRAALEEGVSGVQLMTAHKAKGLEFPVVILADLATRMCREKPDRFIDIDRNLCAQQLINCVPVELAENQAVEHAREKAEAVRLAYVAATRARDLLVMPGFGLPVPGFDSWMAPLFRAITPDVGQHRHSSEAPGCPALGESSVLDDHEMQSVRPGLHAVGAAALLGGNKQAKSHEVVWWYPHSQKLQKSNRAIGYEAWLRDEGAKKSGQSEFQAWQQRRESRQNLGAYPSLQILNASTTLDAPPDAVEVDIIALPQTERKGGAAFGRLIHAALERLANMPVNALPLEKLVSAVAENEAVRGMSREPSSSVVQQIPAAVESLRRWLAHPLAQQMANAQKWLTEVPVDWSLPDGRRLEGVMDAVFFDGDCWHVVDYKTDLDTKAVLTLHKRQLQWYAAALAEIYQTPVKATIVSL